MAHIDMDYLQYDSHQYFWELHSAVARPKSVADVKDRVARAAASVRLIRSRLTCLITASGQAQACRVGSKG